MCFIDNIFLQVVGASLRQGALEDPGLDKKQWESLVHLASIHGVLPLIIDQVYRYHSFRECGNEFVSSCKDRALRQATHQIIQSNEFLTLILHAQAEGLDPMVLKGITVRELYPRPMLRPSVDEDLWVPQDLMAAFHAFLLSEGMHADDPDADPAHASEMSYHKENSPAYIEVHAALFSPDSEAYGDLNRLFQGAFDRNCRIQVQDVSLKTLAPTDHLLFLILHAYKHFVHSGVGIRPVCDIGIYARAFNPRVDWELLAEKLASVHALCFAEALFRIIELYLLPGTSFLAETENIDVKPLLKDILASGLHGAVSMARLHSSNMTLQAVADRNSGKKRRRGLLTASVFLPLQTMQGRYSFLKKLPFLLPLSWAMRLLDYLIKSRQMSDNDAAVSLRLGKERIRLLEQYHITDPKN